jgi:hypothetical protein
MQIIEMTRDELKRAQGSSTVGQILDIMKFSVKMLIVEKEGVACNDALLLNEIFLLLPSSWPEDPVKVHLCTKVIYETLQGDFNNTIHILTKIINVNRIGFYVALSLFWALYLSFFKKDSHSHHYFKMYDRNKFFKLLGLSESKEMDFQSTFQLLMLISIYQNYVLFNKEVANESHQVFSDCFKKSASAKDDVEKLKKYLKNLKTLIEVANPTNDAKNADAFMVCIQEHFPLSILMEEIYLLFSNTM